MDSFAPKLIAACSLITLATASFGMSPSCTASSGSHVTPVVELFTSEGCSSCPPADKWLSTLKGKGLVVQAFHVGYWDYIGWVDRFAAPAYTNRQREIAAKNRLRNIYTPQVVLDGRDMPRWHGSDPTASKTRESAQARIALKRLAENHFEATVTPLVQPEASRGWAAYWTVTEHGHNSKVQAGENSGELLKHDFVVRQYIQSGTYAAADATPKTLTLRSIEATPGHARQINLVVFEPQSGKTLQALSLQCQG